MTENLHLVFSKPPEAIPDEEYNRWYDFHLGEILVVPGFVAARRYRLQTVKGDWTPSGHRYLSAYELEGDPRDVMRELDKEVASGRMRLPGWFPEITFASFNCHSHGNPADARLADHLYLVFSAPPEGLGNDEFVAWYREHARISQRGSHVRTHHTALPSRPRRQPAPPACPAAGARGSRARRDLAR